MNVVCFGDSNTYGYDPRSGGCYGPDSRWVDILASGTGWNVRNMGRNGRAIPAAPPEFPAGTGLLIVMLGTNDLLRGSSPEAAAGKLERFLTLLPMERHGLLLIAPPPLIPGTWVTKPQLPDDSRAFARRCRALAAALDIRFADAGRWDIPLSGDGVHFTAQGHRAFAAGLTAALR